MLAAQRETRSALAAHSQRLQSEAERRRAADVVAAAQREREAGRLATPAVQMVERARHAAPHALLDEALGDLHAETARHAEDAQRRAEAEARATEARSAAERQRRMRPSRPAPASRPRTRSAGPRPRRARPRPATPPNASAGS